MPGRRPNILLVMTDQQRFDTLAAHVNHFDVTTPGMDLLVRHGVTFDHAFCTSPICAPSRASIMTGLYPSQNGLYANLGNPCGPLDEGIGTIADRLQAVGYETVYHGKSHLGGDLAHYGFEIAYENGHDPSTLTEAARFYRNRDWIVSKRPFFHVVSFLNPHDIYFLDAEAECEPTLPAWPSQHDDLAGKPWPQRIKHDLGKWTDRRWEYYRRFYAGEVEAVDAQISELLNQLARGGFGSNTWVIFTADHGDMAGEHGQPFKGPYMYDGVTHVPLIVMPPRWRMLGVANPDEKGGRFEPFTSPVLTSGVDIVPTIMDIAGLDADESLPGRSLLPVIRRETDSLHETVFAEWHQFGQCCTPIRMARSADWKYNEYLQIGEELYDLANDPHEMTNLASDPTHADALADMRAKLRGHVDATDDPFYTYTASAGPTAS